MGNIFIQTDKLLTEEEAGEMWRVKSLVLLQFFASFQKGKVRCTALSKSCLRNVSLSATEEGCFSRETKVLLLEWVETSRTIMDTNQPAH